MKTDSEYEKEMREIAEINAITDERRQDEFDALVMDASSGDHRAIGAIAVALGPTLVEEARTVLEEFEHETPEAGDVLRDLLECLFERRLRYEPAHGRAVPWMCGAVQAIAVLRCREREREWDSDTEYE